MANTKAETLLTARRQVTRSSQRKALAEAAREYSLLKTITARADEIKS